VREREGIEVRERNGVFAARDCAPLGGCVGHIQPLLQLLPLLGLGGLAPVTCWVCSGGGSDGGGGGSGSGSGSSSQL